MKLNARTVNTKTVNKLPITTYRCATLRSFHKQNLTRLKQNTSKRINALKCSWVRRVHFEVFSAI